MSGGRVAKRWNILWGGLMGTVRARLTQKRPFDATEVVRPALPNRKPGLKSTVAIIRSPSVGEMIERAIELSGGVEIPSGATVLVKVNQNSDDPFPATSNPETVAALVTYLKRFEPGRIVVADASFTAFLPTLKTMRTTRVYEAAEAAGAEVLGLEEGEFVPVLPRGANTWRRPFQIARLYLDADFVISQPVIKTHRYAIYSMALKNTLGAVKNEDRPLMHSVANERFWRMVAELNLARPADFVLLDGQKAMVTGGPFTGEVVDAGLMIASRDPVAADALGLAVLKRLGTTERIQDRSVWEQPVLKRAVSLGLGASHAGEIEIAAEGVAEIEEIRRNLAPASTGLSPG